MKRFLITSMLAFVLIAVHAQQDWTKARQEIHENILLCGSNLTAYVDPASDYKLTPTPKGYEPFYLSHYGRHGSRWLTGESQYTEAMEPLQKARAEGKLTEKGLELLDELEDFFKCCDKRYGDLTTVGARQHHRIGRRMTERFPEIFGAKNAEVDARSTVVIRCILSMVAECEELAAFNPRLRIQNDVSESLQYYMNAREPGDISEALSIRDELAGQYRRKWIDPRRFCAALFNDSGYVLTNVDMQKLMRRVFSVCCNMQSHDNGKDLWPYFTEEECYDLWRAINVQWYLGYGNAPQTQGVGAKRQQLLLRNFLETADTIEGKKAFHGATLRFGHETVVMPLSVIMELGNSATVVENLDTLDRAWANFRIFPMASNVQLVFYRPKKGRQGDILVKALLNEREVTLPITPVKYPYYRWEDLKAYYWAKLRRLEGK